MMLKTLTPERVRQLQAWFAGLDPATARTARSLVRKCGNCTHFAPNKTAEDLGYCAAREPRVYGRAGDTAWPDVYFTARCGQWAHPQIPLSWHSALSGVELDRAATLMGVELGEAAHG